MARANSYTGGSLLSIGPYKTAILTDSWVLYDEFLQGESSVLLHDFGTRAC